MKSEYWKRKEKIIIIIVDFGYPYTIGRPYQSVLGQYCNLDLFGQRNQTIFTEPNRKPAKASNILYSSELCNAQS